MLNQCNDTSLSQIVTHFRSMAEYGFYMDDPYSLQRAETYAHAANRLQEFIQKYGDKTAKEAA